jgi:hypothetical protein
MKCTTCSAILGTRTKETPKTSTPLLHQRYHPMLKRISVSRYYGLAAVIKISGKSLPERNSYFKSSCTTGLAAIFELVVLIILSAT